MASKRNQRRKRCGRKRAWPDQPSAEIHVKHLRRQYPGEVIDTYHCNLCPYWHVGHRPAGINRIIKRRRADG
jgi:hypothetical protein